MTPIPWKHVQVVNDDGSNLTAEQVGEYVAKTFRNGVRSEFHVIKAVKEDGKVYDVCHVGNGPDSPWNAAGIVKAVNYHERLVEALQWYEEQARNCRKIMDAGEKARVALDKDGGELACSILKEMEG